MLLYSPDYDSALHTIAAPKSSQFICYNFVNHSNTIYTSHIQCTVCYISASHVGRMTRRNLKAITLCHLQITFILNQTMPFSFLPQTIHRTSCRRVVKGTMCNATACIVTCDPPNHCTNGYVRVRARCEWWLRYRTDDDLKAYIYTFFTSQFDIAVYNDRSHREGCRLRRIQIRIEA